jgi:hypothetical protein
MSDCTCQQVAQLQDRITTLQYGIITICAILTVTFIYMAFQRQRLRAAGM